MMFWRVLKQLNFFLLAFISVKPLHLAEEFLCSLD